MSIRNSMTYLVNEVRRLTGAGTNEYTVDNTSYFSDDQIEQVLDSRRKRMARHQIAFESELSEGGGTVVYKHARIGHPWIEYVAGGTTNFRVTDSMGSILGTSEYTVSPEDGFITFDADQGGSKRYVTGWIHDPYKAALDILVSWLANISHQADWKTDNMAVKRSQKAKMLKEQIDILKDMAGIVPKVEIVRLEREDIEVEEPVKSGIVYDTIPS